MSKQNEKMMANLQRLLETQDFKSPEELKKFMDTIMGQELPSFPKEALNFKEQAQDLVFEAYELDHAKGRVKIEMALQLDADCIEAYEYLAEQEQTAEIATAFYEKGISIGRRLWGGKYVEETKGSFWGFHETRPFMRCLQQYSECLYSMGKVHECIAVMEELIELNTNDNQGVRDQLMLYLIETNEDKKFVKYAKQFENDGMTFSLFNRALFAFKTEGETEASNKKLKTALKQNKFVAAKLLSQKPILEIPSIHGIGDEDEANYYVSFAQPIWQDVKGALAWLKKNNN